MAAVAAHRDASRMTRVRILLVDDVPEFIASAADFLSRDPRVEVVGQAHDGDEGVRMASALAPDIVLMDLVMPVMNGLAATLRIKVAPTSPRVFIISMFDDPGIRRTTKAAGADGFIPKVHFAEQVMAEIDRFTAGADAPPGLGVALAHKPFTAESLGENVREVLDRRE
jgi:DNA-binding NarL/FixJ family response regulator